MKRCLFLRLVCLGLLIPLLLSSICLAANVSFWAQQSYDSAVQNMLVPKSLEQADLTKNVSRLEFCEIAMALYYRMNGVQPKNPSATFTDTDNQSVLEAFTLGIIDGRSPTVFAPDDDVTRQEMAKMMVNALTAAKAKISITEKETTTLYQGYPDGKLVADWARTQFAVLLKYGISNGLGDQNGNTTLSPGGRATREQAIVMTERSCQVFAQPLPTKSPYLNSANAKIIFAENDLNLRYLAEAAQVTVTVPRWRLTSEIESIDYEEVMIDGEPTLVEKITYVKEAGTMRVTVNKNIADDVVAIFTEIFEGPEKFPIKDLGGFAWRAPAASGRLSEHNYGTAIDINWEENYCVYADGSIVGKYWLPGEDPYSIAPDSDVVRAFENRGWVWGANWRTPKDYMHFSFMGT